MMLRLIAFFLCFLFIAPVYAQDVADIRFGKNGALTRVAIDITEPVPYRSFVLGNPSRIVIDLPKMPWNAKMNKGDISGRVSKYRTSTYNNDTTRIVLETKTPMIVAKHFRLPPDQGRPWRYVFDLKVADPITFRQNINKVLIGGGAAKTATRGTTTEKGDIKLLT